MERYSALKKGARMSLQPTAKGNAARMPSGSIANKEATDADVALLLVLHQSLLNINEGMTSHKCYPIRTC